MDNVQLSKRFPNHRERKTLKNVLTNLVRASLAFVLGSMLITVSAQETKEVANSRSHDSGWYPESVHWSPRGTDLLVTACPKAKAVGVNCTLFRYLLAEKRWASLSQLPDMHDTVYGDAVYSPDGRHIVAVETGHNCPDCSNGIGSRLVLLTADGERVRYLTPHGFRIKPTFSKDGTKLLYWSLGLSTNGRTPIGLFDVWELEIASGAERRMTKFLASEIYAPPRYWPDGKRIMLVAGDYAVKPNVEDYRSADGKSQIAYVSVFKRNGTVVTEPGRVVRPYFWPSEDNWLMVQDISPDGESVLYEDGRKCIKIKKIFDPAGKGICVAKPPNGLQAASFNPDGRELASIWGGKSTMENRHFELGEWPGEFH